jgi:AraC-like DNA-binding protein
MSFNLIQITGIFAIFLACIISIYFASNKQKTSRCNIFLSLLLVVFAIMTLCSLILSSGINKNFFRLAHIGNQTVFLIGPLLFFHIKYQLKKKIIFNRSKLIHFIPYIFVTIYLTVKFFIVHIPITCRNNHILIGSISFIHMLTYFYYSGLELTKFGFDFKKSFQVIIESKKSWLPFLVYACFSVWLLKLLFFIVWDISGYYNGCNEIINLYFLVAFTLTNILIYYLLKKPDYFIINEKYKHSALSNKEKRNLKLKLQEYLEQEKVYRYPLISLNFLAKQLSVPERYLSQVINETMNKSFYDLINWYRVRDCLHLLSDSKNSQKTILEIAYEVGYNSKSTFNSSFIKYVGSTPKEFRKNCSNNNVSLLI